MQLVILFRASVSATWTTVWSVVSLAASTTIFSGSHKNQGGVERSCREFDSGALHFFRLTSPASCRPPHVSKNSMISVARIAPSRVIFHECPLRDDGPLRSTIVDGSPSVADVPP